MSSYFSSSGGTSPVSSTATNPAVGTPTIYNATIALADTEQSQALPAGTKYVRIANYGMADLKLAYNATESGTNYLTIVCGADLILPALDSTNTYTLYYQADSPGGRVEIETWA